MNYLLTVFVQFRGGTVQIALGICFPMSSCGQVLELLLPASMMAA